MRRVVNSRSPMILASCIASVMLSGCNWRSSGTESLPIQLQNGAAETKDYNLLYRFKPKNDGAQPLAGLTFDHGVFYGTTSIGGIGNSGTVFSIDGSGTERVVYRFKGGKDGANPRSQLLVSRGLLYGTTEAGGEGCSGYWCGTVFKLTTAGVESVVYRFKGPPDGAAPFAGLIAFKGKFYGTTVDGGVGTGCFYGSKLGCGTVFQVTDEGKERVIESFHGGGSDGANPEGTLVTLDDVLFGTTTEGGSECGCGIVFGVTPNSQRKMSYAFQGQPDGSLPASGLVSVNGVLYGTTYAGGANNYGTVFNITTSGTETVFYSFKGNPDGASPEAGLINVKGTLYGTTYAGGGSSQCGESGCGTAFEIATSGTENVLYNFPNAAQGALPFAPLLESGNKLYGTTEGGGREGCGQGSFPFNGCGTVFRLMP